MAGSHFGTPSERLANIMTQFATHRKQRVGNGTDAEYAFKELDSLVINLKHEEVEQASTSKGELITTHEKFQEAVNANVKQFHNKMKAQVNKITCDLTSAPQIPLTATREDLLTLIKVLHGELKQVVDVVNNAKV